MVVEALIECSLITMPLIHVAVCLCAIFPRVILFCILNNETCSEYSSLVLEEKIVLLSSDIQNSLPVCVCVLVWLRMGIIQNAEILRKSLPMRENRPMRRVEISSGRGLNSTVE